MSTVHKVYHLMRADFLERVRRTSFLLVMGGTVYAAYMMVPPIGASYNSFVIGGHRGVYNSPWIGTVFGVVASTLLTLIGFYVVRDSVTRDYQSRVGQVIAGTPISKPHYLLGKWLSNLAVLVSILVVLTVVAPIMQAVRGEDLHIEFWAMITPIWFMGLPPLAIVAAIAVLFESIPFLRGSSGTVTYFFVWGALLPVSVGGMFASVSDVTAYNDVAGLSRTMVDMRQTLAANGLDPSRGTTDLFVPRGRFAAASFVWGGVDSSAEAFFDRLLWFAAALAILLVAAIIFDRFDPAVYRIHKQRERKLHGRWFGIVQNLLEMVRFSRAASVQATPATIASVGIQLTPFHERRTRCQFWYVLLAEMRLMMKGQPWWWFTGAVGFIIASLLSPLYVVQRYLLPATWLWPIVLWSALGNREHQHHTSQTVFSTAHLLRCQLPATWLAGLMVAIIVGSGAGVRFGLAGQWSHLLAWGIGAAFIPSLALALGVWSSSRRLFEIVYVVLWYLGSIDRIPILDYMGIMDETIADGVPIVYLIVSILLLGMSVVGRRRQLQI